MAFCEPGGIRGKGAALLDPAVAGVGLTMGRAILRLLFGVQFWL
jgi:hypothetical protein